MSQQPQLEQPKCSRDFILALSGAEAGKRIKIGHAVFVCIHPEDGLAYWTLESGLGTPKTLAQLAGVFEQTGGDIYLDGTCAAVQAEAAPPIASPIPEQTEPAKFTKRAKGGPGNPRTAGSFVCYLNQYLPGAEIVIAGKNYCKREGPRLQNRPAYCRWFDADGNVATLDELGKAYLEHGGYLPNWHEENEKHPPVYMSEPVQAAALDPPDDNSPAALERVKQRINEHKQRASVQPAQTVAASQAPQTPAPAAKPVAVGLPAGITKEAVETELELAQLQLQQLTKRCADLRRELHQCRLAVAGKAGVVSMLARIVAAAEATE